MANGIYMDYNCFQRPYDDQRQARIQMEAAACQKLLDDAERGRICIVWSFMHEDENLLCPFPDRKLAIQHLAGCCRKQVGPDTQVRNLAEDMQTKAGLSAKDALHLACAVHAEAKAFLSCDDELLRKGRRLRLDMVLLNPVEYVMRNG